MPESSQGPDRLEPLQRRREVGPRGGGLRAGRGPPPQIPRDGRGSAEADCLGDAGRHARLCDQLHPPRLGPDHASRGGGQGQGHCRGEVRRGRQARGPRLHRALLQDLPTDQHARRGPQPLLGLPLLQSGRRGQGKSEAGRRHDCADGPRARPHHLRRHPDAALRGDRAHRGDSPAHHRDLLRAGEAVEGLVAAAGRVRPADGEDFGGVQEEARRQREEEAGEGSAVRRRNQCRRHCRRSLGRNDAKGCRQRLGRRAERDDVAAGEVRAVLQVRQEENHGVFSTIGNLCPYDIETPYFSHFRPM